MKWSGPLTGRRPQQALTWVGHTLVARLDPPAAPGVPDPDPTALQRWLNGAGDVRFGAYVSGSDVAEAAQWNSESGNNLLWDIKAYYTLGNSAIPSATHKAQANAGHPIHVPVALNGPTTAVPARGLPAPATTVSGKGIWTYNQVTSGAMDGWITWLAGQINALDDGTIPLLSLNIEPENQGATTGRKESFSNPNWYANRVALGDTAVRNILKEYGDAYRYWRDGLEALDVDAVFFLNHGAMGYTSTYHDTNVYAACYPGDDKVDVIGWDPYVNTPASQSLGNKISGTVTKMRAGTLFDQAYFRSGTGAKNKPWMLPEYGCTPTTAADAIAWLNAIPSDLASVTEIKGICYYSSAGTEGTTIHTLPAVRQAFADLSDDALFQP